MASDCGASAAKFQKRDNETLYAQSVLDAPYDAPGLHHAMRGV